MKQITAKKTKLLPILLLFILVIAIVALTVGAGGPAEEIASGECGDDLTWVLTIDGVLTISGTGPMDDFIMTSSGLLDPDPLSFLVYDYEEYYSLFLPATNSPWFIHADMIKSLVIKNGVTSIGRFAFAFCNLLSSVNMQESVDSIGYMAFHYCVSLV